MVINGPWFMGEIDPGASYAVAVLPVISKNNERAKPFLSAEGVIMSAKTASKKEAFTVMEFLTSVEGGKIMATVGRQPTARREVYDDPAVAKDPMLSVFREQLKSSVPMPNTPAMRMVWSPATTAMNKVINGKADPKATMEATQAEVAGLVAGAKR
jgi:maltose-binding protein MalE